MVIQAKEDAHHTADAQKHWYSPAFPEVAGIFSEISNFNFETLSSQVEKMIIYVWKSLQRFMLFKKICYIFYREEFKMVVGVRAPQ